jgi:hypothetical protein
VEGLSRAHARQDLVCGAASNIGAAAVQHAAERLLAALAAAAADGPAAMGGGGDASEEVAAAVAALTESFWAVRSRWLGGARVAMGGPPHRLERWETRVGREAPLQQHRCASTASRHAAAATGDRAAVCDGAFGGGGGGGGPDDGGCEWGHGPGPGPGWRDGGGGGGRGGGEGEGKGKVGRGGGGRGPLGGHASGPTAIAAPAAHDAAAAAVTPSPPPHRPAGLDAWRHPVLPPAAGPGPGPSRAVIPDATWAGAGRGFAAGTCALTLGTARCAGAAGAGAGVAKPLGPRVSESDSDLVAAISGGCYWEMAGDGRRGGGGGGGGGQGTEAALGSETEADDASEKPGGSNGGGGGTDARDADGFEGQEARMDAFFADARRRLAAVQQNFAAGDSPAVRAEARALAHAAAGAGARSVHDAAVKLWDGRGSGGGSGWAAWAGEDGPVRRAAVDGLELQMDAAEAIWRSCRIVV